MLLFTFVFPHNTHFINSHKQQTEKYVEFHFKVSFWRDGVSTTAFYTTFPASQPLAHILQLFLTDISHVHIF